MDEGSITMAGGVVVVYFSRFGKPLQTHHKVVLDLGAKAIAKIKDYEFGGHYDTAYDYSGPLFFVPDDTLLLDEASCLGIRSSNDLYGGVVPSLFVKTKAITHGLVDHHAERPCNWYRAASFEKTDRAHKGQKRIAALVAEFQSEQVQPLADTGRPAGAICLFFARSQALPRWISSRG